MIVIDEYLAIRTLLGDVPDELPAGALGLPVLAHWRLLQRIHAPATGQLSRLLAQLSPAGRHALRRPDPGLLEVLDLRSALDRAAGVAAAHGGAGLLVAETVTAALDRGGRQLWFGSERNVGLRLRAIAGELGVQIRVVG